MALVTPTTVLIADDNAGFRRALKSLLATTEDLVVIASACDGTEAVRLVARLRPRVVVMDLAMPGLNGVEATRIIRSRNLAPAVVALSGSRELMRDAVIAGAAFTVLKEEQPERLLAAIREAARG